MLGFARGPLFRLTFALMVLGLARLVVLSVWSVAASYYRAADRAQPYGLILWRTVRWFLPWQWAHGRRAVYRIIAVVFHIGLIGVPVFLFAHIDLLRRAVGVHWPALPQPVADVLTMATVGAAALLLVGRVATPESRSLSDKQDFLWPLLLAFVFATGFLATHPSISPCGYKTMVLLHVLSGELVFVLIPFSKIAHCVLVPFSHMLSDLAWRFPATSGEDVAATLGKKGEPI